MSGDLSASDQYVTLNKGIDNGNGFATNEMVFIGIGLKSTFLVFEM